MDHCLPRRSDKQSNNIIIGIGERPQTPPMSIVNSARNLVKRSCLALARAHFALSPCCQALAWHSLPQIVATLHLPHFITASAASPRSQHDLLASCIPSMIPLSRYAVPAGCPTRTPCLSKRLHVDVSRSIANSLGFFSNEHDRRNSPANHGRLFHQSNLILPSSAVGAGAGVRRGSNPGQ